MNLYKYHTSPKSLHGHKDRHDNVPALLQTTISAGKEATPGQLKTIKRSPSLSYWYARHILEDEWPPGEKAIATDAHYAYAYARDVLERPWPKGEDAIATHGWWAFEYTYQLRDQKPWPKGEKAIAQDAKAALGYAKHIIVDKWPPGEKAIATDPRVKNEYNHFLERMGYDEI